MGLRLQPLVGSNGAKNGPARLATSSSLSRALMLPKYVLKLSLALLLAMVLHNTWPTDAGFSYWWCVQVTNYETPMSSRHRPKPLFCQPPDLLALLIKRLSRETFPGFHEYWYTPNRSRGALNMSLT